MPGFKRIAHAWKAVDLQQQRKCTSRFIVWQVYINIFKQGIPDVMAIYRHNMYDECTLGCGDFFLLPSTS